MYIYTFFIFSIFLNIARTSALARNLGSFVALLPEVHKYHEHPLHNLDDVAELGIESDGSKSDRLNELKEILEDESQSPDEQSVSKYDENVKVFDNPVVLEATSVPTEDEVKDFENVKAHEKATEDNHFDSLSSLLNKTGLLKLNDNNLFKGEVNKNNNDLEHNNINEKNDTHKMVNNLQNQNDNLEDQNENENHNENNNNPNEFKELDEFVNHNNNNTNEYNVNKDNNNNKEQENNMNKQEERNDENKNDNNNKEENEFVKDKNDVKKNNFSLSNLLNKFSGLHNKHNFGLNNLHRQNHNFQNPLTHALNPELLKHVKLPPVTVNSENKNNFHIFNIHHHHNNNNKSNESKFEFNNVNSNILNNYTTKECFEGLFNGDGPGTHCYCSKEQTCKCTKTYMMLISLCDTMINDPDLKVFCSYNNVKYDHPNLNHRFSKGQDKFIWDAFKNVQNSLCNNKSLEFCENVLKMDKLCQCTKCT